MHTDRYARYIDAYHGISNIFHLIDFVGRYIWANIEVRFMLLSCLPSIYFA